MRPIFGDLFFDRPFVGSTIVAMTTSGLVVFSRWAKCPSCGAPEGVAPFLCRDPWHSKARA